MRPNLILAALSMLLVFGQAGAGHCTTYSTSNPEVTVGSMYVDNDACQFDCLFSIWYYEESNGIPGLQRGDEVVDDTCHGMIWSDTTICQLLPLALLTPRRSRAERRAGTSAAVGSAAMLGAAVALMPTAEAC